MQQKKAVKVHIVYDDGTQELATGSSADEIVKWLFGCEAIAMVHGMHYNGPKLLQIPFVDPNEEQGVPI